MDILAVLIDGYDGFEPLILDLKLPHNIALLLNVDYAQVDLVLTSLASVLNTTRTRSQLAHASLRDFLLDQSRSGKFHVDIGQYNLKFFYHVMNYIRASPAKPNFIRDIPWSPRRSGPKSLKSQQEDFDTLENQEQYRRSDLLYALSEFMRRISLTDDVQNELFGLPLDDIWNDSRQDPTDAYRAILHILHRISHKDDTRHRHLYINYLTVLEPLFRSDMDQLCLSPESDLTDALIVSLDIPSPYNSQNVLVTDPFWTSERCSFAQIFFGPNHTIFTGDDYARAAIRAILTLIPEYRDTCYHFSERHCRVAHNIGYYMGTVIVDRRNRLRDYKHRTGLQAVNNWSRTCRSLYIIYIMDSYQVRPKLPVPNRYISHTFKEKGKHDYRLRHASDQYTFSQRKLSMPRRRRVEKHQRGVTHHVYQRYDMLPLHKTVSSLLPLLLKNSLRSDELDALIERNLRHFEFGYTRYHRIRRAFSDYRLRTAHNEETLPMHSTSIDEQVLTEDGTCMNHINAQESETMILLTDRVINSDNTWNYYESNALGRGTLTLSSLLLVLFLII